MLCFHEGPITVRIDGNKNRGLWFYFTSWGGLRGRKCVLATTSAGSKPLLVINDVEVNPLFEWMRFDLTGDGDVLELRVGNRDGAKGWFSLSKKMPAMMMMTPSSGAGGQRDRPFDFLPINKVPLALPPPPPPPRSLGHGLLICHDYKGNYLDCDSLRDETAWNPMERPFAFSQWPMVETFVYFSHDFISPPPTQWIVAARTNGCTAILGTVITEWDATKNEELFRDPARSAQILASLAKEQKFDGWLVNIECAVPPGHLLSGVHAFLAELRRCGVLAIMYDSVCADTGEIAWQNRLSARNAPWLRHCDGFFLNYGWKPESLEEVDKVATPIVYAGVDCFGRGTWGGGGFGSGAALFEARKRGYAGALFAPGWTEESHGGGPASCIAEQKMWIGAPSWKKVRVSMIPYEGDWSDTSHITSHMWCRRRGQLSLSKEEGGCCWRVIISERVRGTPPNCSDPYYLRAVVGGDGGGGADETEGVASEHWKSITLDMMVVVGEDSNSTTLITIEDGGMDAEHWGGHYGVQFESGHIDVQICCMNWPRFTPSISDVYPPRIPVLRGASWMCIGAGDSMYRNGVLVDPRPWSNMALQSLLPPQCWRGADGFLELTRQRAFNYGSSLLVVARVPLPLYQLQNSAAMVVRVFWCGAPLQWFLDGRQLVAQNDAMIDGGCWRETVFTLNGNDGGVLLEVCNGGATCRTWIGGVTVM